MLDSWGSLSTKILSGLLFAKQFNPRYIYIVDADDWINTRVVDYLEKQPDCNMWYVNKAYVVNFKDRLYTTRYGIVRHCGSTLIYQYDYIMSIVKFSQNVDENSSQGELLQASSVFFVHDICGNHTKQYRLAVKSGFTPKALPFPAICYVLETGENEVQHVDVSNCFPIKPMIADEFGLSSEFINVSKISLKGNIKQRIAAFRSNIGWWLNKYKIQKKP